MVEALELAYASNCARAAATSEPVRDGDESDEDQLEVEVEEDAGSESATIELAEEGPKKRTRRTRANKVDAEQKFAYLADILPKLPQKGGFDVKKIKDSQYFFS